MMRHFTFAIVLLVAGGWSSHRLAAYEPDGAPSQDKSQDAIQQEMRHLAGTWVGTSYDLDGKQAIPLKKSQGITLQVERFTDNGVERLRAACSRRHIGSMLVEPRGMDSPGGYLDGPIELDVAHTPRVMTFGTYGGDVNPYRLAYELKDDQMRLVEVGADPPPSGALTSNKGEKRIVFNLRRVADKNVPRLKPPHMPRIAK